MRLLLMFPVFVGRLEALIILVSANGGAGHNLHLVC